MAIAWIDVPGLIVVVDELGKRGVIVAERVPVEVVERDEDPVSLARREGGAARFVMICSPSATIVHPGRVSGSRLRRFAGGRRWWRWRG